MRDNRPPMLAADHIRELTRTYTTSERITRFVPIPNVGELPKWDRTTELVTITHMPLIAQLEEAVNQSRGAGDFAGGVSRSKPNARLDALDVLQRIERQSARMARDLNLAPMPLPQRLSAISGALGPIIDKTVRAWWISARCTTGWEQAPYEPDVPCPNTECEQRGTLRIRLDTHLATCTKCGEVWDEHNYTQLGDYIRWASEHLRGARHWLYDADGYPIECVDCLIERQVMAERAQARAKATEEQPARRAG